jgi:hypothetical protein
LGSHVALLQMTPAVNAPRSTTTMAPSQLSERQAFLTGVDFAN